MARVRDGERYEPLPGLAGLPAWLWRKLSIAWRVAVIAAVLAGGAGLVVAIGALGDARREQARAERSDSARALADRVRRLKAEVRPFRRRSAPAGRRLDRRRALLAEAEASILANAVRRARAGELDGEAERVRCEAFARSEPDGRPEDDLRRSRARYACLAVTSAFARDENSVGGEIGHPYRVLVDFATGRYTFCKTVGVAGPERDPLVRIPRECGGN